MPSDIDTPRRVSGTPAYPRVINLCVPCTPSLISTRTNLSCVILPYYVSCCSEIVRYCKFWYTHWLEWWTNVKAFCNEKTVLYIPAGVSCWVCILLWWGWTVWNTPYANSKQWQIMTQAGYVFLTGFWKTTKGQTVTSRTVVRYRQAKDSCLD